jgi:hypothetical protein
MMAGENDFPYTPTPNSLRKLLNKIPTIGTPSKASQQWLAGVGFSGGNNKRSLAVMRQVGIIAGDGTPTEMWTALRSGDKPGYADGIRKSYASLFSTYPDAHRTDDEALLAFVRSATNYSETTQKLAVRTFRVLCEFGDFTATDGARAKKASKVDGNRQEKEQIRTTFASGPVGLTVNIQLQLPASADGDVYDKLFEAMGRHLKGLIRGAPDGD